jgi:hypothetical protein
MIMETIQRAALREAKTRLWVGWGLSGLVALFLLMDAVMKLIALPVAVETTVGLGYPESVVSGLGVLLLLCTALYVYPRTSVLGAILLTGYLGGGVATHVRVESPLLSHVLFGVYLGLFVWGGLYLREERLRAIFPLRR